MKTKHYHNTNAVDLITARLEAKKNLRQEDLIYAFFKMTSFKMLTASEVHNMYNSLTSENLSRILGKEFSEHYQVPLTSIRRGISNLQTEGYLEKTNKTQAGRYGKQEHFYRLSQIKIDPPTQDEIIAFNNKQAQLKIEHPDDKAIKGIDKTIEGIEPYEEEIIYSCCGDEMTGLYEDIQICPTCKEHQ